MRLTIILTGSLIVLCLVGFSSPGFLPELRFSNGKLEETPSQEKIKQQRVLAERFHFTPSTIKVKQGTILRIELSSRDTFHGFHILGTDINLGIPARGKGKAEVIYEATEAGTFEFVCSKRCGAGHTEMRGKIVVKP